MRRLLPVLMLILVAGCTRGLADEKTIVANNDGKTYTIDPSRSEQKLRVVATATDGKIDVYIFLAKDKAAAQIDIDKRKYDKVIAYKEDDTSFDLTAAIPKNEEAAVFVRAHTLKEAKVTLKITN